ncbi:glycosyltransferase [Actinoplanes sp. NPDC049265]|uniref:glycosyltransferase n=1 Tax=Actinoplanes sp. NPDC049265 TaxID=3363902 RepID=UPI00372315BD
MYEHVSVVIPTTGRNSSRTTLEALAQQDQAPPFEVIVAVDGGPAPDLSGVARHAECTGVEVVRLPDHRGVSAARNAAIEVARGDLIGFLDDDVEPDPRWLTVLARGLETFDGLAGRIVEDVEPGPLSRLRRLAFDNRDRVNTRAGGPVDYLNGGNFGVRADLLRRAGRFDVRFVKSQDRELARRIVRSGAIIGYASDLIVRHRGDYTVAGLVRGRYRAGRAAATMAAGGDLTSVGPRTVRDTYGAGLVRLAFRHGLRISAYAALSMTAHRAGRMRTVEGTPQVSSWPDSLS